MEDELDEVRKILAEAGIETDARGVPVWQDQTGLPPGAPHTDALPVGPEEPITGFDAAMQAYPYQPDPEVEAVLKSTDALIADSRALLEDAQDGRIDGVHGPVDTSAFAAPSSSVDATADLCHTITGRAMDAAEGRLSPEEMDALDKGFAHQVAFLEGFNATENIYNNIADHEREARDQDMAHHHRMMEHDAAIEADDALDRAAHRIDDGLEATSDLDWAEHELNQADYHHDMAEDYDNT